MSFFVIIINSVIQILILVIIVQSILTFFLAPTHPVREALDGFVAPLLSPIRRVLPPMAGLDFSPLVLIIILEVVGRLLVSLLAR